MERKGRIGLRMLFAGVVVLASIGTARSATTAKPCCFTSERYVGVCRVVPAQDESCASILAYLNGLNSSGKTYCDTTGSRGEWQQVRCGDERSGQTGQASSPSSVSALADKGVGAVLARDAETYTSATGGTVQYRLKAGTILGFFTLTGGWGQHEENGLYGVAFFADNNGGDEKTTWVKPENLATFYWECAVSKTAGGLTSKKACIPADRITRTWRLAFTRAAGEKCNELGIKAFKGSVFAESVAPAPVEPPVVPTTPMGPSAAPTIPMGSSAVPTTPMGPSAAPTTPMGSSAVPTTPLGPSAAPTTPMGPSVVPTTPLGPQPTPTARVEKTSP